MCENTTVGLGGDVKFLKTVSAESGVHIVAGAGHFKASYQTESTVGMTVEQLVAVYTDNVVNGIDDGNGGRIKYGFFGEIGAGSPVDSFEKRTIEATALVQQQLGCGVSLHPDSHESLPFEMVRLYLEAGGRADKCVMSHLDSNMTAICLHMLATIMRLFQEPFRTLMFCLSLHN